MPRLALLVLIPHSWQTTTAGGLESPTADSIRHRAGAVGFDTMPERRVTRGVFPKPFTRRFFFTPPPSPAPPAKTPPRPPPAGGATPPQPPPPSPRPRHARG